MPQLLKAPFAPGGAAAIDAALAHRLLALALDRGGDYADLFFEYRIGTDVVLEDERIKSLGRAIVMGLGVRVLKGDATGYAFAEAFPWERMQQAARLAAQIADGGGRPAPVRIEPVTLPDFYPTGTPSVDLDAAGKLAFLQRADKAARGADPRIARCE